VGQSEGKGKDKDDPPAPSSKKARGEKVLKAYAVVDPGLKIGGGMVREAWGERNGPDNVVL